MVSRAGLAWLAMACTACTRLLAFDEVSERATDRSGPRDAGIDAAEGDAGDAAALELGFCASARPYVTFCDDFDAPDAPFASR